LVGGAHTVPVRFMRAAWARTDILLLGRRALRPYTKVEAQSSRGAL